MRLNTASCVRPVALAMITCWVFPHPQVEAPEALLSPFVKKSGVQTWVRILHEVTQRTQVALALLADSTVKCPHHLADEPALEYRL
jgi:hypothetical protein